MVKRKIISKEKCLEGFDLALGPVRSQFVELELAVSSPVLMETHHGLARRYASATTRHAILMKFARMISLLGAMKELVASGYVQEQGILQRVSDETGDDILFLALGNQNGLTRLHRDFLKEYWREEFEHPTLKPGEYRPRRMVRRSEIRAYNDRQTGCCQATVGDVGQIIYSVFSGFVHGASTAIFDLLDPRTGRYRLTGVTDASDRQGYIENALNYPYRLLMAGVTTARALGASLSATVLMEDLNAFEAWLADTRGLPIEYLRTGR